MMLASIATGIAHIKLRLNRPDAPRPYRTIGFPLVPLLFIIAYAWFAMSFALESPLTSLVGVGLALTGIPFYYLWKKFSASS